jgi:hypothetical protein
MLDAKIEGGKYQANSHGLRDGDLCGQARARRDGHSSHQRGLLTTARVL